MNKITFLILTFLFTVLNSFAISPEEYCDIHKQSGAPGDCEAVNNCAILHTNLGTDECKVCTDGGCEKADCSECGQ